MGVFGDQTRGQVPFTQQPGGPVKVGHHHFQQIGTLAETGTDVGPFGFVQQDGEVGQGPVTFV